MEDAIEQKRERSLTPLVTLVKQIITKNPDYEKQRVICTSTI